MVEDELQRQRRANKSLTRELLSAYEELDLLHTLASIFATSADVDEMGTRLVDEAVKNLDAAAGFLIFTGEGMEEFEPVIQGADPDEVQAFVRVAAPQVLRGESVLLDHALAEGHDPRPLVMVPLRSRDGIFGALGLLRAPGADPFTAGENKALLVLATQAAGVILQKRNLDLTYLSDRLRKSNEGLEALLDISRELTATLDVNRVLAAMVNLPGKVVPYERASISLKEGSGWRIRAVSGMATADRSRPDIRRLESLHAWVGERGDPVRFELGTEEEGGEPAAVPALFVEALRGAGMVSFQSFTLADEEGVLGILALERSEAGGLPEGAEEVLAVLINQASVALRNAQLYSQVPLIGLIEPILEKRRRFQLLSRSQRFLWGAGVALLVAALFLVPVPLRISGSCRLVAEHLVSVSPSVAGRVMEVAVAEGETVRAGQVLARLDDRELRLKEGEAQARVQTARRRVRQLEAQGNPEAAALERTRVHRLEREEELAAAALAEAVLLAPRDGVVVTPRLGQLVGQRLEPGDIFCLLTALDSIEAEVAIAEVDAGYLEPGRVAEVKLDAYPQRTFVGRVVTVRPVTETRDGRQVVVARVRVDNEEQSLRPGMLGRARLRVRQTSLGRYLLRRPVRWVRSLFWF